MVRRSARVGHFSDVLPPCATTSPRDPEDRDLLDRLGELVGEAGNVGCHIPGAPVHNLLGLRVKGNASSKASRRFLAVANPEDLQWKFLRVTLSTYT
jgi:hypothetical protein